MLIMIAKQEELTEARTLAQLLCANYLNWQVNHKPQDTIVETNQVLYLTQEQSESLLPQYQRFNPLVVQLSFENTTAQDVYSEGVLAKAFDLHTQTINLSMDSLNLVRFNFNPGNNLLVTEAKLRIAQAVELLVATGLNLPQEEITAAKEQLLLAQMRLVYALTTPQANNNHSPQELLNALPDDLREQVFAEMAAAAEAEVEPEVEPEPQPQKEPDNAEA